MNKICAVSGLVVVYALGVLSAPLFREDMEEERARAQREADTRVALVLWQARNDVSEAFVRGQLYEKWQNIGLEAIHRYAAGDDREVINHCLPVLLLMSGNTPREYADLYVDLGIQALNLEVPEDRLGQFCVAQARLAVWQIMPVYENSPYLPLWYTLQNSWAYASYSIIELR
jgi:hypothetical protein